MLETIKLVAGTVADKDLVPAFTHIHIYDGRIQGMDGRAVAIDAACPEMAGIHASVPADRFLRAVTACDGEPRISEKEGKLLIRRKSFQATLPLMAHADYPKTDAVPEDVERMPIKPGFVGVLKRLKPFISQDASRPWTVGVQFKDGNSYATNNAILVSLPYAACPLTMRLPTVAVDELIRINQDPKEVAFFNGAFYFFYASFWVRVLPMIIEWPNVEDMLSKFDYASLPAIPGQLLDAVRKIAHFHPDPKFPVVLFNKEGVHTMDGNHKASVEGMELAEAKFRAEIITLVLNEAIKGDFSKWPAPMPFYGMDKLRGMVVGVKT